MKPRLLLLCALTLLTALSVAEAMEERITSKGFERLMQLLANSWNKGDARKAADCFAEDSMLLAKLVDLLSISCTMTCQLKSLW